MKSIPITYAVSADALGIVTATSGCWRRAARYAWAMLLVRIYFFPLLCPKCGGEMRIIAFVTEARSIRQLLEHLGEPSPMPRWPTPTRARPQAQPPPEYEFDQRIAW